MKEHGLGQRFTRMGQLGRLQAADGIDQRELLHRAEPVQLAHALLGKSDLIHGEGQVEA